MEDEIIQRKKKRNKILKDPTYLVLGKFEEKMGDK